VRFLTIAIPNTTQAKNVANRIMRALDPDVGGDKTFANLIATDAQGTEWCVSGFPIEEGRTARAVKFLARYRQHLDEMAADIVAEYGERFPQLTAPALNAIQQLIQASNFSNAGDTASGMADLGLTPVVPS